MNKKIVLSLNRPVKKGAEAMVGSETIGIRKKYLFILFLIVAVGLFLRLMGLKFGFPHLLHPDEPTALKMVFGFFRTDLNPRSFKMPSLYLYLVYFSSWIYCRAAALLGGIARPCHLWPDKTSFYLIGRLWPALLGTATIVLVFAIASRLYSRRTALGAALLLAILPLHVLHSHYATVDVPVTFFITASFYFSVLLYRNGKRIFYPAAGLFAGLAAGTKYNGALALFPFFISFIFRLTGGAERKRSFRFWELGYFLLGILACGLAFFLSSPFIVKEAARFVADLQSQSHYLIKTGHGPIFIDCGPGALYNIRYILYYAGGAFFWFLSLAGVIYAAIRHKKSDFLIFSWLVPYFILISIPRVRFARFFIPLLPFLAILGGRLLDLKFSRPWQNKFWRAAFLAGCAWVFLYSLGFSIILAQPDVRIQAKDWIERSLPSGSRLGMVKTETGLVFLDDPPLDSGESGLKIERYQRLLPALQGEPDYLVVTDFDYRQILRLKKLYDQLRCDRWHSFFREEKGYRKIKEFDNPPHFLFLKFGRPFPPHDMMYNYPRITIYKKLGSDLAF